VNAWALGAAGVGPLGVILVALVAVAGALAIHVLRRRKGKDFVPPQSHAAGGASARPAPSEDPHIAARMRERAARMGLSETMLPAAHAPNGDGNFVWRDGGTYRYQSFERGGPVADHSEPSLDAVLFHVFRDRAWMHAYLATVGSDEATREARIAEQQRAMLAAGDPAWAGRL
jgi:hypothetical protein